MTTEIKMKKFNDIFIKNAILHVIDNKQKSKPELSDLALDIRDKKTYEFLKVHINDSLLDSKTLKAKFNHPSQNTILSCYIKIADDDKNFIDESKKITENLFKFMGKTASSGCLIICSYENEKGDKFLAILKMDYSDYHIHERVATNDGKMYNKLITKSDGLPSIKDKLQKCAFIKHFDNDNEYDLLVLDKQRKRYSEDEVSKFFYDYFLDCNFTDSIRSNTKKLLGYTKRFIKSSYNDPVLVNEKIGILFDIFNSNKIFNAKDFSQLVFEDEEIREQFIEKVIKENDFDIEIEIDNDYTSKRTKQVPYNTAEGVEVKVPAKLVNDKDVFEISESEDRPGTFNIFIKNVHIEKNNNND